MKSPIFHLALSPFLVILFLVMIMPTSAQESSPSNWKFNIGFGTAIKSQLRSHNTAKPHNGDFVTAFFPLLKVEYGSWSFQGRDLEYRVWGNFLKNVTVKLTSQGDKYQGPGTHLRKPQYGLNLGAKFYFLQVDHWFDAFKDRHGSITQIDLGKKIDFEFLQNSPLKVFRPSIFYEYYTQSYNEYFYGISREESQRAAGSSDVRFLQPYQPKAAHNFGIKIFTLFDLEKLFSKTNVIMSYKLKWLDSEIKNSPTQRPDSSVEHSLFLGLSHEIF